MIKNYIVAILLSSIVLFIYMFSEVYEEAYTNTYYRVYLHGDEIGLIDDETALYELINNEQKEIKEEFGVDQVYPPNEFNLVKVNTYHDELSDLDEIYDVIESNDDFAIMGYTIRIKTLATDEKESENITINVLEKEIFDAAIMDFVTAFIDETIYIDYINKIQEDIADGGSLIEEMYFLENISIKENYISVNEKIFTDKIELTQFLIFGEEAEITKYKVKSGDTITSIADDNELNPKEFLIANPNFFDENTMLEIGSTVNVTLLDPMLNFIYQVKEVKEVEIDYTSKTEVDSSKATGYSEVTQSGVTGIEKLTTAYLVTNGLPSQEVDKISTEVIREKVDKVTVVGPTYTTSGGSTSTGDYLNTGLTFTMPVNSGFIVTSPYGEWRSGVMHNGTDFSGTGYGSPIYAIASGVVTQASNACSGCSKWSLGTYVVINHGNNYYSNYLHMVSGSLTVSVGQSVVIGQKIGTMGSTGYSTGTHLHLGFSVGEPYASSNVSYYNAYKLILGT